MSPRLLLQNQRGCSKSFDDGHLKDLIVTRIGKGILGNLVTGLHEVEGKRIVVIDVKKASEPCFLKPDDAFYVRTSPATEQLTGKDLLDYIRNNF